MSTQLISCLNKKCLRSRVALASGVVLAAALVLAGCNGSSSSEPRGEQFDRMGNAGVNTVFIPSAQKNDFNQADPSLDEMDYGSQVVATTRGLRDAVAGVAGFPAEDLGIPPEAVRDIVIPDVITLDLSAPVGFPNGRALSDDVIDTALQVTLNRSVVGDGISNDSAFITSFPYLGAPN